MYPLSLITHLRVNADTMASPVIGSFLVVRKGWRWTQWVLMMFGGVSLLAAIIGQETYHPVLERRRAKKLGLPHEDKPPLGQQIAFFVRVSLLRPVHMLVAEPIVTLTCLYVACEFATLFGFFAGVPYVFSTVYGFSVEQQGLVFVAIIVGCLLGAVTIALCTRFLYAPRAAAFPPGRSPPELRLFPGIVGCFGPPVGLFLFGWTARESISWAAPAVAIVPFAWGNFCIFVCCMHYLTETYKGTVVASASSANSLARYTLAGLLPLFTVDSELNPCHVLTLYLLGLLTVGFSVSGNDYRVGGEPSGLHCCRVGAGAVGLVSLGASDSGQEQVRDCVRKDSQILVLLEWCNMLIW